MLNDVTLWAFSDELEKIGYVKEAISLKPLTSGIKKILPGFKSTAEIPEAALNIGAKTPKGTVIERAGVPAAGKSVKPAKSKLLNPTQGPMTTPPPAPITTGRQIKNYTGWSYSPEMGAAPLGNVPAAEIQKSVRAGLVPPGAVPYKGNIKIQPVGNLNVQGAQKTVSPAYHQQLTNQMNQIANEPALVARRNTALTPAGSKKIDLGGGKFVYANARKLLQKIQG